MASFRSSTEGLHMESIAYQCYCQWFASVKRQFFESDPCQRMLHLLHLIYGKNYKDPNFPLENTKSRWWMDSKYDWIGKAGQEWDDKCSNSFYHAPVCVSNSAESSSSDLSPLYSSSILAIFFCKNRIFGPRPFPGKAEQQAAVNQETLLTCKAQGCRRGCTDIQIYLEMSLIYYFLFCCVITERCLLVNIMSHFLNRLCPYNTIQEPLQLQPNQMELIYSNGQQRNSAGISLCLWLGLKDVSILCHCLWF